jgi:hypothetical protein
MIGYRNGEAVLVPFEYCIRTEEKRVDKTMIKVLNELSI